jgi:hypothetical protein
MKIVLLLLTLIALLQPSLALSYTQYDRDYLIVFWTVVIVVGLIIGFLIAKVLLSISESELMRVIDRHNELFKIDGVVAVEVDKERRCIIVYVEKNAKMEDIPRFIDGFPVEVKRIGKVKKILWQVLNSILWCRSYL